MANNRELSQFGNYINVNTNKIVGINTNLIVSGVVTATTYYGDGSKLTGIATVGGGATLGLTTVTQLDVTGVTSLTTLNVSGIATFGKIVLNPVGFITASSGVVTYYGDGSKLTNILFGVGIRTSGGLVGTGVTTLDFRGTGISTVTVNSGIATINIIGNSGSVSISSAAPSFPSNGNLWYSIEYGRTFIYYDEAELGIGSTAVWVDAAPFNQNGLYVNRYGDTMYAGLGVTTGSSSSPSVYFNLYSNSGFYSPAPNEFGVVVSGTQRLNVNPGGINVAGVVTATSFVGGVVTATSFVGDGSGLTGAGSTVADDTTTDSTFYPVFTSITNGTITASKVSTTKLTFNPSTGTLTATDINSSSDSILKENIETVEGALDKVNNLRGVKFNWKEDGRPSYGVIAQELEQVLPELVSDTDPKTVNYNGIISVLIEAVKELTQRVEELENKS